MNKLTMDIKLIKSSFMEEQKTKDALCSFIQGADQLSIGEYCRTFEQKFAQRQGRKYCVFFNSGSSANLALVQSLLNLQQIKKGDTVGFSALTRATNIMPIIQLGLVPVPIDIELDTLNASLSMLKKMHEKTPLKVLFITNLLGRCHDIDQIQNYCDQEGIVMIEDNCESMGTIYKGKKLGNYSRASTFSTYVGHHMSTIEGGMVCTDDQDLYDMLCMTRAHGWDRNLSPERQDIIRKKYGIDGTFYAKYTFYTLGYNLRPSEINGFIGCEQIQYLDGIVQTREVNARRFVDAINTNPDFHDLRIDHIDVFSNFAIPVVCKSGGLFETYRENFQKAGIEIRPIVGGDMTQQLFWTNLYGQSNAETNAKYAHNQGFYFGNSPEYLEEEIAYLLTFLRK